MKVIPINSSKSFKFHGPRASDEQPERPGNKPTQNASTKIPASITVLTGLGFTAWLPTLAWCYVSNNVLPLYLVVSAEILGSLLGLFLYAVAAPSFITCVPVNSKFKQDVRPFKKAA